MEIKIAFFVQARMGSSRLPNKVLLPFFENKSILKIITSNLKKSFPEIPLIICTSENQNDDAIENFCKEENIECFRGSENNVLKRFTDAISKFNVQNIIRICADNPFLNMDFLNELIEFSIQNPNFDYWSFKNHNQTPVIKTHFGLFAEIVTANALVKASQLTQEKLYLEHVTNYIYESGNFNFKLKQLPNYLNNREDIRFTIDDVDDFENLKEVFKYYFQKNQDIRKTVSYIDENHSIIKNMVSNIKKYSK